MGNGPIYQFIGTVGIMAESGVLQIKGGDKASVSPCFYYGETRFVNSRLLPVWKTLLSAIAGLTFWERFSLISSAGICCYDQQ